MTRISLLSLAIAIGLALVVLELVRRRRLQERYSLLWLAICVVVLVLAIWQSALTRIATSLGIVYPPNALFALSAGFFLILLLHFSTALSRLSAQNTRLAQRQAIIEERLRRAVGPDHMPDHEPPGS
jgi:hypothetical protein